MCKSRTLQDSKRPRCSPAPNKWCPSKTHQLLFEAGRVCGGTQSPLFLRMFATLYHTPLFQQLLFEAGRVCGGTQWPLECL